MDLPLDSAIQTMHGCLVYVYVLFSFHFTGEFDCLGRDLGNTVL